MKRCPSCGAEHDRDDYLSLPGKAWPEVGLWLRLCVCGTTLSVPMVGRQAGRGREWHALVMVGPMGAVSRTGTVRRGVLARPDCDATGEVIHVLAPEGEEPSCATCRAEHGYPTQH